MDAYLKKNSLSRHALTIIVVSDNRMLADALHLAFRADTEIRSVRQFTTLSGAVADTVRAPADCTLVEAALLDGRRATDHVRRLREVAPVVIYGLKEVPEDILDWARLGASGFVPRSMRGDELVEATKAAARGEPHCSARVVAALLSALSEADGDLASSVDGLTLREREVARLVVRGHCNKRIAQALGIEHSTAKSHMHNILRKTNLRNRRELEVWYRRQRGVSEGLSPTL